jgi:hypothetical protein
MRINDPNAFKTVEKYYEQWSKPAEDLYDGQGHNVLKGVLNTIPLSKCAVDWHIVSAGYGLIRSTQNVLPYEMSFNQLDTENKRVAWGRTLGIPFTLSKVVKDRYDLRIFCLSEPYLQVCQIKQLPLAGLLPSIFVCSENAAKLIPKCPGNVFTHTPLMSNLGLFKSNLTSFPARFAAALLKATVATSLPSIKALFKLPRNAIDVEISRYV